MWTIGDSGKAEATQTPPTSPEPKQHLTAVAKISFEQKTSLHFSYTATLSYLILCTIIQDLCRQFESFFIVMIICKLIQKREVK